MINAPIVIVTIQDALVLLLMKINCIIMIKEDFYFGERTYEQRFFQKPSGGCEGKTDEILF